MIPKKHQQNTPTEHDKMTVQEKLIISIDKAETINRRALKDIDNRLFNMVFAYAGSLDYCSIQILEATLIKGMKHIQWVKKQIAESYVKKDLENNPELQQHVDIIKDAILKTQNANNRFSRN